MQFAPEERSVTFKYPLQLKVYFMHNGKPHSGTISERYYRELFLPADWDYDKDRVSKDTVYVVHSAGVKHEFKEYEFSRKVYTDKQKFIDDNVIIS
ncbi:hypothetical protein DYU11_20045 [Fibrisoma montanum]|uniref:Uncharacterized protein n=1 Tax=Fibrisoma montanum TaxID=2305895 RepID=A0A418M3E7_9BACT|nr:hypothetical protein [Fibrisoma montanum]RIV20345.1 hypothetical protein DYU11_20045 [Fibrisoma montanum]